MSVYTKIARPYAKAAFEYAVKQNFIEQWNLFLQKLSLIIRDDRIQIFLKRPDILMADKLSLLCELSGCEKDQQNFLYILAKYNRLLVIPDLAVLFEELLKQYTNTITIQVTTAFPISSEQKVKLQKALEIRLGKQVQLKIKDDKKLIGGVVIRAENFVIDGSVQAKLKRLQKMLIN